MADAERLAALVEPVVERAGAELVDLEVTGGRDRPIVRAYVDTDGGITLDACARLSRLIEPVLESSGAVPERYVLEVSSPGLERPLTKRRHFEHAIGQGVTVRVHAKRDGRKQFVGTLEHVVDGGADDWSIVVVDPASDERWTFTRAEIAKARLRVDWTQRRRR